MRTPLSDSGPDDSRPPYRFSLRTLVELADTDLYGVVYYGRYARLLDRAVSAYRRHLGLPPLGVPEHFPVVRKAEFDYLESARYGDELTIFVRVARVGDTSLTLALLVTRSDPGPPVDVATAEIVTVGLDEDGRPSPVPDDLRSAVAGFEGSA